MHSAHTGENSDRISTLEAFADTIVPGEKRSAGDRAIAGAADGPGAVAAGAVELLGTPATGLSDALDDYVRSLNEHATAHAARRGLRLDPGLPPFTALSYEDRTAVVAALVAPGHPEHELWVLLTLFCNMAFDTGAHLHTTDALAAGHPGLTALGFAKPDADGLWRFPRFSYRRPLARPHPDTAPSGSPA
ncbi:regulator [Streptomyces sp. NRRL B-1677]|uniref:DUF5987 family protein n=1 Tax=Streptomyces sp. NRRL B-1677 TaxID=2682966 RepID=UPI001892BB4E|nr:DUF5987 family protein [Streptomyces sp. NRRL B-1677]MBF6049164.1 regulator [Streptomyces sp. NRRL B-1677]